MRTKLILLVEDDDVVAAVIRTRLECCGEFSVDWAPTAYDALKCLAVALPDAMLLDTTLPDLPAQEICRSMRSRARTRSLPCILLGDGRNGLRAVDGLAIGADDYVTKPIDVEELEARLRAVLRRRGPWPLERGLQAFHGAHIDIDFGGAEVLVDRTPVSLTRRELLLLRALVERCNRTISRNELSTAWGADTRDRRVVDSAMWKLRRKLRSAGSQIQTVVGFGYRFNEPSSS